MSAGLAGGRRGSDDAVTTTTTMMMTMTMMMMAIMMMTWSASGASRRWLPFHYPSIEPLPSFLGPTSLSPDPEPPSPWPPESFHLLVVATLDGELSGGVAAGANIAQRAPL